MKKPYLQKIQTGCFLQLKLSKFSQLKSRIKKNEGYSNQIYYDQVGKPTIGFGHLIKKREKFLHQKKYSKKYLNNLFENDFSSALSDFNKSYKEKVKYYEVVASQSNSISNSYKYNRELVESLTGLKDAQLTDFMEYLNLDNSFISKASEYEIAARIRDKIKEINN